MTKIREIPHKWSVDEKAMLPHLVDRTLDNYAKTTERILGGDLDNNLHTLFNSFGENAIDNGIIQYFFFGVDPDLVLNMFGEAAHAYRNLFDIVEYKDKPIEFQFQHSGATKTAKRLPQMSMQYGSKITRGLDLALLSGSKEDVHFLASLGPELYDAPGIIQQDTNRVFTQYMQVLFAGMDKETQKLRQWLLRDLAKRKHSGLFAATCSLFLAIPDRNPTELSKLTKELLAAHKKWITKKSNCAKPNGFICIRALVALALMHQRGVSVSIQDPYIPQDLQVAVFRRVPKMELKKKKWWQK